MEKRDEQFNDFDLAIPAGLSYLFDFGLLVDLRYNIGVLNLQRGVRSSYMLNSGKVRSNVLVFSAGFRF